MVDKHGTVLQVGDRVVVLGYVVPEYPQNTDNGKYSAKCVYMQIGESIYAVPEREIEKDNRQFDPVADKLISGDEFLAQVGLPKGDRREASRRVALGALIGSGMERATASTVINNIIIAAGGTLAEDSKVKEIVAKQITLSEAKAALQIEMVKEFGCTHERALWFVDTLAKSIKEAVDAN